MYKLIRVLLLVLVPVFGILFYLYAKTEKLGNSISNRMNSTYSKGITELKKVISYPPNESPKYQNYLNQLGFPSYRNITSTFLPDGNAKLEHLLKALKKAETFIFIEYFIITLSKMWDEILAVLIERQKAGVEIRIMYDDFRSATKLP